MSDQKRTRKFVFGNENFGGSYTPGDFEINFPDEFNREEFERIFNSKMESLHRRKNEFAEEIFDYKVKKENLKPLSIRVKQHTKEFFKNNSIHTPREVLEMYENFNNGSEAFINSLLEEQKDLEKELAEVQEKLRNAELFKEKLSDLDLVSEVMVDKQKISKLEKSYPGVEIKAIGNETPAQKASNDIIRDIQIYNTVDVRVCGNDYLVITVYTNAVPVAYYFKNEYSDDDISEIVSEIEKYCGENDIGFRKNDDDE